MSAGMAEVIAAHPGHEIRLDDQLWVQVCFGCPWRYRYSDSSGLEAHAAHVAEELAKAGYVDVQEAKRDHVRSHTIVVTEATTEGFNFEGCSDRNPDACACSSYVEVICLLRDESICDGELIQAFTYPTIHSVDYASIDQEWETDTWHARCADPLAAATADPEGRTLVQAIHDRKAGA